MQDVRASTAAPSRPTTGITPAEARAIAREAYLYTYPIVENYHSIYQFALRTDGPDYKGPPNQIHNVARVFGPEDKGVVTPNSDTPYSFLIMDLRAEPLVVTLPPIESGRYYSLQLVDLYTHDVDYLGTRVDGNGGGDFLITGPEWQGDKPDGIRRVVRIATQLVFSQFRTQLKDAADIENVKQIQSGYTVLPLSTYLKQPTPPAPPRVAFPPITREMIEPRLFEYATFLLQFCSVLPHEQAIYERLTHIGVSAGELWPPENLSTDVLTAIEQGKAEAHKEIADLIAAATTAAASTFGYFGSPEQMAGRYVERAIAAKLGLYGNPPEEALYFSYYFDSDQQVIDTGRSTYTLRFPPNQLPPVDAFWSLTMYDAQTNYLVENPLDRYLINSSTLETLNADDDGGLTLFIQRDSPGPMWENNWLPAPAGPARLVLRLYLPKPEVLSGDWSAPPIHRAGAG